MFETWYISKRVRDDDHETSSTSLRPGDQLLAIGAMPIYRSLAGTTEVSTYSLISMEARIGTEAAQKAMTKPLASNLRSSFGFSRNSPVFPIISVEPFILWIGLLERRNDAKEYRPVVRASNVRVCVCVCVRVYVCAFDILGKSCTILR